MSGVRGSSRSRSTGSAGESGSPVRAGPAAAPRVHGERRAGWRPVSGTRRAPGRVRGCPRPRGRAIRAGSPRSRPTCPVTATPTGVRRNRAASPCRATPIAPDWPPARPIPRAHAGRRWSGSPTTFRASSMRSAATEPTSWATRWARASRSGWRSPTRIVVARLVLESAVGRHRRSRPAVGTPRRGRGARRSASSATGSRRSSRLGAPAGLRERGRAAEGVARGAVRRIRLGHDPAGLAASLRGAGQGAMEPLHDRLGADRCAHARDRRHRTTRPGTERSPWRPGSPAPGSRASPAPATHPTSRRPPRSPASSSISSRRSTVE